jgi:Fibronectin type III domain
VIARSEDDTVAPAAPGDPVVTDVGGTTATIAFVAPGDDGATGKARKYDIRYLVGDAMTEAQFDTATPIPATVVPDAAGAIQSFDLTGLLPETSYAVGIRAVDDCRNTGPLAVLVFETPERSSGQVDACFIATAAYGSVMANDVDMLRRFRDALLRRSVLGELAVETYYTFGPAVGNVVGESDLLRHTARELLAPVVDGVKQYRVKR